MNETLLWGIIFLFIGIVFFWLKRQQSSILNVLLTLGLFPLTLVLYLSAHKFYYYLAVNSSTQQRHCGIFHQYQTVKHYSRSYSRVDDGSWTQYLYEFKTEQGQIFIFAHGRQVARHLPLMGYIQPQQKICFQYSPRFKDREKRYLLTGLSLQNP